jgi:glycosyltransferase involved in cell wall biosynthesis/Flp pilus assembly protein TadD
MKASVLITTYNHEKYIRKALDSVLMQKTDFDFEILIGEDDSNDLTREICKEYAQKYASKIRLFLNDRANVIYQNGKPTGRWNTINLFNHAKGEFIARCEGDDFWICDRKLQKQIKFLEKNPDFVVCFHEVKWLKNGKLIKEANLPPSGKKYYGAEDLFLNDNFIRTCSVVYRNGLIRKIPRWFYTVPYGDVAMHFLFAQHGKIGYLPETMAVYRVNRDGIYSGENSFVNLAKSILTYTMVANQFGYCHKASYKIGLSKIYHWAGVEALKMREQLLSSADKLEPASRRLLTKKSQTPPLVSVIVPTFNRPQMLEASIKSIISQTMQDFEIIVVNDAGQDISSVLKRFKDKRIKYLQHNQNKGLAAARNTGIKSATGKYITYLDDDDIYYPNHLEILVNYLESSNYKVAYTDAYRAHYERENSRYVLKTKDLPYSSDFDCDRILTGNFIPVLCFMHEKKCLDDVGLFDETLTSHEDWDLWIRMSRKYEFGHIKKVTAEFAWLMDGSTMTSGKQADMLRTLEIIYAKHADLVKDKPHIIEIQDRLLESRKKEVQKEAEAVKSSIVIPVFNKIEYTRQCLEALFKTTPRGLFELIVVDNSSSDGTQEYLKKLAGEIKIITNEYNLGFAKACNQGARAARGELLVFLNNDTVPLAGWLEALIETAEYNISIGIVGGKLLYPDGKIQHAGVGFINGIPDHPLRNFPGDHPEANETRELDMVTGACLLIKKDLFFECGGFDEQYKNGVEDIDLCLKVRMNGYKVIYNPKSTLYHYEGKTPGRYNHVKENLKIFFARWKKYFDDEGRFIRKAEDRKLFIKWEGSQFVNHSLALVNRELCIELAKTDDIKLSLIPYEPDEFGAEQDPERFRFIADRLNSSLPAAADFHVRHKWPPDFTPPPEGHWIMIQPWEFGALPKDWVGPMESQVDELWVPSQHVRDVYIGSGISAEKVFVIPNGVNYSQFHPQAPKMTLATPKRFKFLFVGGTISRKGIDVLLGAYTQTFNSADDVCLVIKDMGGETFYKGQNAAQMIADIQRDPAAPEILYLTETVKIQEMAGLYTACDCLVHPYRGEGFGLPVAEAMACGLPVIVTKGGACDDFCSEETVYFIASTPRPVEMHGYQLSAPGWLLEPDKLQLMERLKFVYEHPQLAKQKGKIAANQIKSKVNWKMSTDKIQDRLKTLKGKPIRRLTNAQNDPAGQEMKSAEESYQVIQQSMRAKTPKEVIDELERLAESYPEFALAHNDLGVLFYHTGDLQKAQDHYERAVEMMPDNINFLKNLADFYCIERGRIEDALKIYVRILQIDPQDAETLMATGQICRALEKFDDARDFFNQVLQIEPGHAEALKHIEEMGRPPTEASLTCASAEDAYRRLQKQMNTLTVAEAIGELETLVASYPDFEAAYNDLGVLYYRNGDRDKSLSCYQKAVHLQPQNPTFQKNLADFLFVECGKTEEALCIYKNVLDKNPDDLETLLICGHICAALEKFDEAGDYYQRVLTLEPDHTDASHHLDAITNRNSHRSSESPDGPNPARTSNPPAVSIAVCLQGIQNRIKQCVESLAAHTQDPFEILLIDNGATKGALKWARDLEKDPVRYRLVKCDPAHSWGQCLNQAVRAAAGEFIVWVHNDVIVADGWFRKMKQCLQAQSEIGVVGPLSNAAGGIQKAFFNEDLDPNRLDSDASAFYAQNQHRRIPTTRLASFCLMFRWALWNRIGDFDEQLISEQAVVTDFCKRAAAWGFQNLVAGDVLVYHADRHKGNRYFSSDDPVPDEDKKRLNENWSKMAEEQRFSKNIQMLSLLKTVDELLQKGYGDQAVDTLLNAIGALPSEKMLYLTLAEICISLKRYQDAIDALHEMSSEEEMAAHSEKTIDQREPDSDGILSVGSEDCAIKTLDILGYAAEGLEDFTGAADYADKMLALDAKSARALNLKGILAYRQNDLSAAAHFFQQSIANNPRSGEPYSNLAAVKLATDRENEALKLLEQGFLLSPTDLDVATNYHAFINSCGDYNRAEKIARQAAVLYPKNRKIAYMLIDFLIQQGNFLQAMDNIEASIVQFGIEDGILAAALKVRKQLGCMMIKPSKKKATVSCCMIIKDEEKYLARCLASVKPIVDEMIVVDTGSVDRSKDIATVMGAKVYDYEWCNDFAKARNYSLEKASGDWILILDGDEVISPLDYKKFSRIVKNRPQAPIAYTIVTRNYSALANIVGWVPNDGKYAREEAAAGWIPSVKTRLFCGREHIWFEGAVHELVDPVVKRKGFQTKPCNIPVHHYGRLDKERLTRKGEVYFEIGKKKLEDMGDDVLAVREMAIQATTLEKNELAIELWQKLISLEPSRSMVADAYINMATLYNRVGDFDQALVVAQKAVEAAPNIKESLYNYALAELHVGNAQTTINVLKELICRVPDYPPAQFILAAAYFCMAEKERGLEIIQALKTTPLGPNLVYPIAELADTLMKAQMNEYALLLLGAAIESDTVNKQILELFNTCIQKKEATGNGTEPSRQLAPERQPVAFQHLPQ